MPNEKSTPEVDRTTLMLAYICVKNLSTLPEQVEVLDRFGFTSQQIAAICGGSAETVRKARMLVKKEKPKGHH